MEIIKSFDNKLVKSIKKLLNDKKYRDSTNLYVAEGKKVVDQLLLDKQIMRNVVLCEDCKYTYPSSKESTVVYIKKNIYEKISSLQNGDGVIGIFIKSKNIMNYDKTNYLILNHLQNIGNIGTIIRTAIGFNMDGIIITNDSVDIYNPQLIRATMGCIYSIPMIIINDLSYCIGELRKNKIKIFGTVLNNHSKKINDVSFDKTRNAIIISNEGQGLKPEQQKLCDENIYIPIKGIDSLNAAIAAGIIMNKIFNK